MDTADLTAQDAAEIKRVIARWVGDFVTNNRDDLATIITSDMVLQPPGAAAILGHQACMDFMKGYPPITKFTYTVDEVGGCGDLAYARGDLPGDFRTI